MKLDQLKTEFLTFLTKYNPDDLDHLLNYVYILLSTFERNTNLFEIDESINTTKNDKETLIERITLRSNQIIEKIQFQILSLEASNIFFDPELEAVITNEANEAANNSNEKSSADLSHLEENQQKSLTEQTNEIVTTKVQRQNNSSPTSSLINQTNETQSCQINQIEEIQPNKTVEETLPPLSHQVDDSNKTIRKKSPGKSSKKPKRIKSKKKKNKKSKSTVVDNENESENTKNKRKSTKYPMYVINHLTKEYNENKYPTSKKIREMALETKLSVIQVAKWFSDRRSKLKHTHSGKIPSNAVNQLIKAYNKNKYPKSEEIQALSTELQVSYEQVFNWFRTRRSKLKQTDQEKNKKVKKPKQNVLPEHITNYLIQKYNLNKNPNRTEIEEIALETHLTTEKINNWFKKRRVQLNDTKPNALSDEAIKYLTEKYAQNKYPNAVQIQAMSYEIHLATEQIFNWFRTRRQRLKETRPTKYPPEIINYMMQKFNTNFYPSAAELQQISTDTSLTVKQVNQWFSDRRYKLNHKEIKPIEISTLQGQQILENTQNLSQIDASTLQVVTPTGRQKKQRASRQGVSKVNGFPAQIVEYLNEKFEKNNYPTPDDIQQMVSDTGLAKKQINQWFNDKRYRSNRTKSNKYPEHVIRYLIDKFTENNYPSTEEKHKIALETKLTTQQVNKWYEDRRYKTKPIDSNSSLNSNRTN